MIYFQLFFFCNFKLHSGGLASLLYHCLSPSLADFVVHVWKGFQAEWELNSGLHKSLMKKEGPELTTYLAIKLLMLLEHLTKFFIAHQSFCIQGLKAPLFKSELFKLAKGVCTTGKARLCRESIYAKISKHCAASFFVHLTLQRCRHHPQWIDSCAGICQLYACLQRIMTGCYSFSKLIILSTHG